MEIDLFLLNMDGANLVLGIEWHKIVGSVLSNYNDMSVQFNWMGETVTWVGEAIVSDDTYSTNELKSLVATTTSAFFFFCRLELMEENQEQGQINRTEQFRSVEGLAELLEEHNEVFAELVGLPPKRQQYHNIHLEKSSDPMNVRPYRQAQF